MNQALQQNTYLPPTQGSTLEEEVSKLKDQTNPRLSNKQRAYVALLLLLGTLIIFGILLLQNPGNAFHHHAAGASHHQSQGIARP